MYGKNTNLTNKIIPQFQLDQNYIFKTTGNSSDCCKF